MTSDPTNIIIDDDLCVCPICLDQTAGTCGTDLCAPCFRCGDADFILAAIQNQEENGETIG